jgi:hypothetical protein
MSSYHGPGTYYIVNSKANTSVDLLDGNPKPGVQINGWYVHPSYLPSQATLYLSMTPLTPNRRESVDGNPHQIWLIADRGLGEVIILNYNTGSYIAAPAGMIPTSCRIPAFQPSLKY